MNGVLDAVLDPATEIHEVALAERKEKSRTLYQLEVELQSLYDMQEEESTEERWAEFTAMLCEQLPKNVSKRQAFGEFIRHWELFIENVDAEQARLAAVKKWALHIVARARASAEYALKALGRGPDGKWPQYRGRTLALGLRDNADSVKVDDEWAIPPKYKRHQITIWGDTWAEILQVIPADLKQRVVEEINQRKIETTVSKTRIKEAIQKRHEKVPGADLESTKSLVIR